MLEDLRYALRMMLRTPALTAAAVLSLGLGIGANTTIYTWVRGLLLRPMPGVADSDRVVVLASRPRSGDLLSVSYPDFRDLAAESSVVDGMIAQRAVTVNVIDRGATSVTGQGARRAWAGLVTANYFDVLGVRPRLGRGFLPEDERPHGADVAVLSDGCFLRMFGGDPAIVGRVVEINNKPVTVVGIAPPDFAGSWLGIGTDLWVPMSMETTVMPGPSRIEDRGSRWMQVLVRLRPDVTLSQAQAALSARASQLAAAFPKTNDGRDVAVVPTWRSPWGVAFVLGPVLGILSGFVALVLLMACANVAGLLLARGIARRREIALRLAIGASRGRIVRQLLVESLAVGIIGGAAGLLLTRWTSGLLRAFAPRMDVQLLFDFPVEATTMALAGVCALVTGLVAGLAPALQASRPDLVATLREETGTIAGGLKGLRLRSALTVLQVCLSLVLLVAAVLFFRSVRALDGLELGFDERRMLLAQTDVFPSGYDQTAAGAFGERLLDELVSVQGVRHAALARRVPLGFSGSSSTSLEIEGYVKAPDEDVHVSFNVVSPDYFATVGARVLAGRPFTRRDRADSPRVLIVNEAMANRYWPDGGPIGRRARIDNEWHEIVGVVATGKYESVGERPRPFMYFAFLQQPPTSMVIHAATEGDPAAFAVTLRTVVARLDSRLALSDVRTMEEHLALSMLPQRVAATLVGGFGVLALILAIVGLYGVIAYAVSQRTRELGVRLALGASPRDLRRLVVRQGLVLSGLGVAIGLGAALATSRALTRMLPGVDPADPLTYAVVSAAIVAIAVVASLIPARRAAKVDALTALRG